MSTRIDDAPTVHSDIGQAGSWRGFRGPGRRDAIDLRQFLQDNYRPYEGDASFLTGVTDRPG